ncbi:MAG: hypothetical protein SNJ84_03480 [Verrucomicrobiia bacterium]
MDPPSSPAHFIRQEIQTLHQWMAEHRLQDPLIHALKQIERRLGTPDERADDLHQAREMAHLIRNRLTGILPE